MLLKSCAFFTLCLAANPLAVGVQTPVSGAPTNLSANKDAGGSSSALKVEPIPLKVPPAKTLSDRKAEYSITVSPTGKWIDTGFAVTPADHMDVTATGSVTLGDGHKSDPAGFARGWKDMLRSFPDASANPGALIGRVRDDAAAVPFPIGASLSTDVHASGELFLAVNASPDLAGPGADSDSYKVTIKLSKVAAAATTEAKIDLAGVLTPTLLSAIPRRVADKSGDPGDVVNYAIVGTREQVENAFTAAGWVKVDTSDNDAVLHGLLATLSKESYLSVPMSTLYLFGRPQDLSYARAEPIAVAFVRHHLRVWDSGKTINGRPLWVGSATHDNGLERDQRNNGVTHHIDPNIDTERDFIEQSFAATGSLEQAAYVTPPDPVHDANTATGGSFHTDGRVLVMVLR